MVLGRWSLEVDSLDPWPLVPWKLTSDSYTGQLLTEGFRTTLVAFGALGIAFAWQTLRTALVPVNAPERLVSELRLSQFGALLLVISAGAYVGFAVAHENVRGVGFDVAFSVGFFVVAAATMIRDPRQALTILAVAFAAHAVVDVAHRPGLLPSDVAPRWFFIGCAVYDLGVGALCYVPMLRRG